MREADVSKEYHEDVVDEIDEEYRWWEYAFDFGDRRYRARVYTDEPAIAHVDRVPWDARTTPWWRRASRDPYLHAIHHHLRIRTVLSKFTSTAGEATSESRSTNRARPPSSSSSRGRKFYPPERI